MDSKPLPNDTEALQQLVARLQSQLEQRNSELAQQTVELSLRDKLVEQQAHSIIALKTASDSLDKQVIELELKLEKLLKQLYGRKSERSFHNASQLLLDLGEDATPEVVDALEEAIREAEHIVADAEQKQKQRRARRPGKSDREFPEHLPRVEKIIDIPEEQREGLKLIGYDQIESLHWKRPELYVLRRKIAKYVYPAEPSKGIISPQRPTGLVEGDRFDASVAVEVVACKYFYHLPFYRQQDKFSGSGWTPSRSSLANLELAVEFALRPLAAYLHSYLKTDSCVGCDDTSVLLITPKVLPDLTGHPRAHRITEVLNQAIESGRPSISAKFWGYYASRLPVVAFDFTVSRHRDGPDEILGDYAGNLIGDCWSGFQKIDVRSDSRIQFAACWAHARRKIDECRKAYPDQVAYLDALIGMLYDVEDQIKGLSAAQRLARRQSISRAVLSKMEAYLASSAMSFPSVLPKSNLGEAAGYVRRHWEALNLFTAEASVPLDNNDCEQLMKISAPNCAA
jgi:transposase